MRRGLILFVVLTSICLVFSACQDSNADLMKSLDELLDQLPEEEVLVYVGSHDISEEAAMIEKKAAEFGAEYSVSVKDNENNDVDVSSDVFNVEYGKTYTVTLTVKLGEVVRTKTITLRAARNFTVTFDLNGGVGSGSISYTQTVIEEDDALLPEPPTRTNYIFDGWSPQPLLENVTTDATYAAVWKPTYLITFNSNGGSGVDPVRVYQGEERNLPASLRSGYYFGGWYLDNGTFSDAFSISSVNSDSTVYAEWVLYLGTPTYNGQLIPEDEGAFNTYLFEYPASSGPLNMELFNAGSPDGYEFEYVFGNSPDMSTGYGELGITVLDGETEMGIITIFLHATE